MAWSDAAREAAAHARALHARGKAMGGTNQLSGGQTPYGISVLRNNTTKLIKQIRKGSNALSPFGKMVVMTNAAKSTNTRNALRRAASAPPPKTRRLQHGDPAIRAAARASLKKGY